MRIRILAFAALFISFAHAAPAAAQIDTVGKQAIVVDYDTGAVLYEKNADEHMPTSSMSKTLSIYLVFDALKSGRITMDSTMPVSEKAWRMQGSKMFVHVGDNVKVEDLIKGVIIQSGNDAAIVLAEGLSGTEESFADALNEKARQLGMTESHFVDASGMPDPEHYSTARDLASMTVHLIHDYPEYYPIFAEKEFVYNNIKQGNRNPLLYRNIGADGVKTGHTEVGGYGMIGSGVRDGRRVVFVVNGLDGMQSRADEGAKLLDWGLRAFQNFDLFKAGDAVTDAAVVMGQKDKIPLVIAEDAKVTVPSGMRNGLKVEAVYKGPLRAPVKKGDKVGTLTVESPRLGTRTYDLLTGEDVEPLGFFAATMEKLKLRLQGREASGG